MKNLLSLSLILIAIIFTSCGDSKIEPANPAFTYKEYQTSYPYEHNLKLDGCFEIQSIGAIVNDRPGMQENAEIVFTINIKMIKNFAHKPFLGEYYSASGKDISIQYLDKDNNVVGEISPFFVKHNIFDLSKGQTGSVTGTITTTKEDAKELLSKIKYVRVVNISAFYEDEAEKESYENGKEKENEEYETSTSNDVQDSDMASGSTDWDAVLDSYEKYVDKYIRLLKKAEKGDMDALAEYPQLFEQAQEYMERLSNAQGELSSAQLSRYMRITNKIKG